MKKVLLGDVVDIIKGISYRSSEYSSSDDGVAFINLKSVARGGGYNPDGVKYYAGQIKANQYVEAGDILIANTDLTQNREIIGSPIIMPNIDRKACFSLDLSKIVIKKPDVIYPKYLFYYLKSPLAREFMLAHSNGSTVMHLSIKSVPNMEIKIPSIEKQKKIADILDTLDEKIELNRRMNETLEQIGQTLFRHYFIDNSDVNNWRMGYFSDIADIVTGKGSTKSRLSEGGSFPLYGANGVMGVADDYLYDEPLVITGRVGTLGQVRAVAGKAWYSDNVLIMRPKRQNFGFVYYTAKSFDYASLNRGSTQPLVTQTDLRNRRVAIPDKTSLNKFEIEYSQIFEMIQQDKSQTQILYTLRDTLLPQLMTGSIKV